MKVNEVMQMLTRAPPNPTAPSCVGALGYTLKAECSFDGASADARLLEWPVARCSKSHDAPSRNIRIAGLDTSTQKPHVKPQGDELMLHTNTHVDSNASTELHL